ncbi:uncharacterized protein PAC_14000 [Phialocephala subalpina]|uniref:Potassium channel domain-containing protein n=1 Tax=Phialocephala subalpina TaxID=576137 RepID=A0A1L7XGC9_9HELO|nr:uncharacterized protein PAC_14000 [Phialocephala subalpina]
MSQRPAKMEINDSGHVLNMKTTEDEREAIIKAQDSLGREWFTITAFPLFAGTFGPIASALNICALVQPWRCEYASAEIQTDAKDIADPAWLIGINSISLVFGVAANLAIMFVGDNLTSSPAKYSFYLVLITVIGGGLASFILVALVVAASIHLRLPSPPEHAFTEAYYYAIMAAGVYFITSAFVVYTAYMLFEIRKSREGRRELSKQFAGRHRSLKILTTLFVANLLIGAAIFSKIEGWRYLDGVFWANVTILTIGFGDFKPVTHLGRSLLMPWAISGIVILFLVIYYITQVVFERGKSVWEVRIRDQERLRQIRERDGNGHRRHKYGSRLRGSASSEVSNDTINCNNNHVSTLLDPKKQSKKQRIAAERAVRERDFLTMRSILQKSSRRRIWYSVTLWLAFALFLWFFGAVLFHICERNQRWTYFTSVYFTFISLLAIGYGDDTLHSMPGKAIFVLWSLIVVPTLTMLISTGTEAIGIPYLLGMQEWFKRRVLKIEGTDGAKTDRNISHTYKSSKFPPTNLPHNTHDKNHLLIRAIKLIARDHIKHQASNSQPDYSFDDWEYVFYLMDVLEPSSDDGPSPAKEKSKNGEGEKKRVGHKENTPREKETKKRRTGMEEWQDGSQIPDWLHGKNPLNVSESSTEWMLLALMEKLESELAELRRKDGNTVIE